MTLAELRDLLYAMDAVEMDGKWVCEGKAILPSKSAGSD